MIIGFYQCMMVTIIQHAVITVIRIGINDTAGPDLPDIRANQRSGGNIVNHANLNLFITIDNAKYRYVLDEALPVSTGLLTAVTTFDMPCFPAKKIRRIFRMGHYGIPQGITGI